MKFLDLFAGIGGFRLGMESAGHECIGFCEIDKFARASYKAIHDTKGEIELHDITAVSDESIRGFGSVDVICGGFPCQAFSIAGNRRGFEDTRGTLFFEIARFASILRPRYLFLENVKGLLNHENGITFETIISTLDELGYDVEWQVLNSKDFGVPQNRERVFIIGHLRGERTRRIFPLSGESQSTSSQSVVKISNVNPSGNGMNGEVYQVDGLAPTLTTNKGEGQKIAIKSNTIKQFGVLQPNFNQCGVVYETDGIAPTIRAYYEEIVKQNQPEVFESKKVDTDYIDVFGALISLEERYEALLELLPQDQFSKAGTHPKWVADAVAENTLNKEDTMLDVSDLIGRCNTLEELKNELTEYFDLEEM